MIPVKLPRLEESLKFGTLDKLMILSKIKSSEYPTIALEYMIMQQSADKTFDTFVRLVREGNKPKSLKIMREDYRDALDKLNNRINAALNKDMK